MQVKVLVFPVEVRNPQKTSHVNKNSVSWVEVNTMEPQRLGVSETNIYRS